MSDKRNTNKITVRSMQDAYRIGFLHGKVSGIAEYSVYGGEQLAKLIDPLNFEAARINDGLKFNVEFKP